MTRYGMRTPRHSLAAAPAMAIAAGLLALWPAWAGAAAKDVKIGLVYPTTGVAATLGQAMVNGHILALEEINASGGIRSLGGARLVHVMADTQGKPEIGMSQTRRVIEQEGVALVQGAYQSPVTFVTTQLAEQKRIPHIVPIGAADNITERGFKYTFKISPKGSKAAVDMLTFLQDIGKTTGKAAKTVGLVYVDNLFGKNQARALKDLIPKQGYNLVADLSYPDNTTDVTGVVAKLKAANPDVVLQASYTQDGILISRALADQSYAPPLGWLGFGGNAGDPQFFDAVGKQAENYLTVGYWIPDLPAPGVKEAAAAFRKRFNMEMDEYSASAYIASYVVADALERAASTDPQKLRDAVAATNMKVGARGNIFSFPVTFPPDGQTPSYFITYQNQGGRRVVIAPKEAARDHRPIWPAVLGTAKR